MRTIINVANRLPVTVGETIRKSSGGLISALEGIADSKFKLRWVGWPGGTFEDPGKRDEIERRLVDDFHFTPIFLTQREVDSYYHGLANSSLWPILHYMATYMHYEEEDWETYLRVNRIFADKVLEMAEDDDLVWVHDYHLMLLPRLLHERRPSLRIGFFFHTPFPSSEVFRCHPRREELLRGVLGADLIGFHTFGYLRHFRSAALRILGLESNTGDILDGRHNARLGVFPIGINSTKFENELRSDAFRSKRSKYEDLWKGKRIVLSVERLDYTKGILHRLDAVDRFLTDNPDREDVMFIFVNVPSRSAVPQYQTLKDEIEQRIGMINGRHATVERSPIHFIHNPVEFTELCALYSIADVALVTPLVDGMNLVAKEYVACQQEEAGVLVLSEFAGAAQELFNAIIVNPYDTREVAESIRNSLELPEEERRKRMKYMRARVLQFDADYWANTYLDELSDLSKLDERPIEYEEAERSIGVKFEAADRVACFLDYDGTLREFEDLPGKAFPHEDVRAVLDALDGYDDLDVYIVSGRKPEDLERWLGNYHFTLVAEHGNSYRMAHEESWIRLNPIADFSWKEPVLTILRHYEGSTPGSFVEEKTSALVWHYRRSDPEFGEWKAKQLMSEIYAMLANLPVEIHHGKKIVEVSSINVSKGAAVDHFLRQKSYDLIICAGDDQTDEAMFRLEYPGLIGIKVGAGDTSAKYRIRSPQEFRGLLARLVGTRVKR